MKKRYAGTAMYMSINTHMGIEQSRRDDLESIGYMLIFLMNGKLGKLPWQGLKVKTKQERFKLTCDLKKSTKIKDLCKNCPSEFKEKMVCYFNHVKNLNLKRSLIMIIY